MTDGSTCAVCGSWTVWLRGLGGRVLLSALVSRAFVRMYTDTVWADVYAVSRANECTAHILQATSMSDVTSRVTMHEGKKRGGSCCVAVSCRVRQVARRGPTQSGPWCLTVISSGRARTSDAGNCGCCLLFLLLLLLCNARGDDDAKVNQRKCHAVSMVGPGFEEAKSGQS